jgi:hypothetical protein
MGVAYRWPKSGTLPMQPATLKTFYMDQKLKLSKLMHLSWEVQRRKRVTRAKALRAAWAILLNEDIAVYHLVRRYGSEHRPNRVPDNNLSLFSNQ